MKGFVLYDGPSAINGERIVVIMTKTTGNRKTGPMPQVWYLVADKEPHIAHKDGDDVAVCGGCSHSLEGSCYVVLHQGPLSVYRAWKRGIYGTAEQASRWLHYQRPRFVRLGAYGDPMAAPLVMAMLAREVEPHDGRLLGYTHRWQHPSAAGYQRWLMASADTPAEGLRARSKGWRTFRVRLDGEPLDWSEVLCSYENSRTACNACGECDGARKGKSVVATVHGLQHLVKRFKSFRARRDG